MRNAVQVCVLAGFMFCSIIACCAAEQNELSSDWPKTFLKRWCGQAVLAGPVELAWEKGRRDSGGIMGVYPGDGYALVTDSAVPAKMMCVEIDTGHERWTNTEWPGTALAIDNLLFSQKASLPQKKTNEPRKIQLNISYGILSCLNGAIVKETEAAASGMPHDMAGLVKLRKRMEAAKNPQIPVIEDSRQLLLKTFYSPDPAKNLPSGNIAQLTHSDIKGILDAVKASGLPHHGAGKGFVIPNATRSLLVSFSGEMQLYEDLTKEPIWSVKLAQSPDPRLLYTDDLCFAVTEGYKVTAVHTDSGKISWEFEADVKGIFGGPTRELVALEDGVLFFTDPVGKVEVPNQRDIVMTKLDKKGRVQFQQSLPSQAHSPKIYFSNQYLLIQTGGHIACYRPKMGRAESGTD